MIAAQEVTFAYRGDAPLLEGFSAAFPRGAVTAVTGDNGCGKTTLAKLLVGIERPAGGRVLIAGTDIRPLSLAEIGRLVGCVYQNPSRQLFCTTVTEEVAYGLRNLGLGEADVAARVEEYLGLFGLLEHAGDFPLHLSQGEKQRLMLAVVLSLGPSFVVLDEPTTGLDLPRRRILGAHLRLIADTRDCGVIVISHERSFVSRYADDEIRLGGRL